MTSNPNSKSKSLSKEETTSTELRVLNYQDENKSLQVKTRGTPLWSDSPNIPNQPNQPMFYGPSYQQGYQQGYSNPQYAQSDRYATPTSQPFGFGGFGGNPSGNQFSMFTSRGDEDVFENNPFFTTAIRNRFVQRVYTILTIQLLITLAIIALCVFERKTRRYILTTPSLFIAASIIFLVIYITLICCPIRRKVPLNFICLFALTIAMGITLGATSTRYDTKIVVMAVGITAGITFIVSIFAVQTSFDITACGPCLCVLSTAVILFGIVVMIISLVSRESMPLLELIFAIVSAFLFTAFLMFDTQMIVGGRTVELSPEEYIAASLQLYVDIVLLFQYLLVILGFCSDD